MTLEIYTFHTEGGGSILFLLKAKGGAFSTWISITRTCNGYPCAESTASGSHPKLIEPWLYTVDNLPSSPCLHVQLILLAAVIGGHRAEVVTWETPSPG